MSISSLEVGIVGLPNVGKSTLFNAITKAGAEAANYPFCTIEPNVGVVEVPDARLEVLRAMNNSKRVLPATMRFVDIAGLVKGASTGEGLGNKFLAHIREVDAVAQVVRCFQDENITHVEGNLDPLRDIEIINTELCLADIEGVEKRIERLHKMIKAGDKKAAQEKEVLEKVAKQLGEAIPVRRMGLSDEELETISVLNLLTNKPSIFIAKEDEVISDVDVASLYPSLIIEYGFYPPHLGKEFLEVYKKFKKFLAFIGVYDKNPDFFTFYNKDLKYENIDTLVSMKFFMETYNYNDSSTSDRSVADSSSAQAYRSHTATNPFRASSSHDGLFAAILARDKYLRYVKSKIEDVESQSI